MAQIAELNNTYLTDDEDDANYLYKKDVYNENTDPEKAAKTAPKKEEPAQIKVDEDGFELPDFISEEDGVIKID